MTHRILTVVAYLLVGVILLPINAPALARGFYEIPVLGLIGSTTMAFGIFWMIMSTFHGGVSRFHSELATISIGAIFFVFGISTDITTVLDGGPRSFAATVGVITTIFWIAVPRGYIRYGVLRILKTLRDYVIEIIIFIFSITVTVPLNMVTNTYYEIPALGMIGSVLTMFGFCWTIIAMVTNRYFNHSSPKWELYTLCAGSLILAFGISTELTNHPLPLDFRSLLLLIAFLTCLFGTMAWASETSW
jgi:hypothetical protein